MKLQGQQRGFAMVVLIVGLSIMAVMMTAAMPVWKQIAQREKEAELVFRGEQYARAIGLFQRKNGPGTLPPSFDVLVDQKFLRKKFKDPITDDEFVPVALNAGVPDPGTNDAATRSPPGRRRARERIRAGRRRRRAAISGRARWHTGGGDVAGIAGVTSKSKETSIRLYKGRNHYNEWMFIFTPPAPSPARPVRPEPVRRGSGDAGRRRTRPSWRPGGPGAPGRPGGPGGPGGPVVGRPVFPGGRDPPGGPAAGPSIHSHRRRLGVKTLWSSYQLCADESGRHVAGP